MSASENSKDTTSNANGNESSSLSPPPAPFCFDSISRASDSEFSFLIKETELSPEKFSRLVSEYSKIRLQLAFLRKAYIEEKTRGQTFEELLKQREQDIRKLEQETESLDFRNTQLSKRVGVLQNDLDESGSKSRSFFNFVGDMSVSNKHRTQSNTSNTSAGQTCSTLESDLFEELSQKLNNKMIENEQLKSNISLLESRLSEEGSICAKKIKDSQSLAEENINNLNQELKKLTNHLQKVKNEKSNLEDTLKKLRIKFENVENASKKKIETLDEHTFQSITRSGSFSGDVRNRLTPGLPPRSGSLSIQNRSLKLPTTGLISTTKCIPSHSSSSYQDENLRNTVIDEFSSKISELICALSTVHSHFAKKISMIFASFNNGDYHFYFHFDNPADAIQNHNNLRQISQTLRFGYDTPLINLEESTKKFVKMWKKSFNATDEEQESMIAKELKRYSLEIVQAFEEYVEYLKKIEPLSVTCLNNWSKILKLFNSNASYGNVPEQLFASLSNNEKRFDLIQKHQNLSANIQDFVRILFQIFGSVKLFLTRSMESDRFLAAFNQFMQRVNSIERCHEDFKQNMTTKYALEHELFITVGQSFLENDDCLVSALAFLKTIISDIRVLMEVSPNSPIHNRRIIPEEDEFPEGYEEDFKSLLTKIQSKQLEIEQLHHEKDKIALERDHKELLLGKESQRVSELEMLVQKLKIQLEETSKEDQHKPKLSDQLSTTSCNSVSATPMVECFGVQFPVNGVENEETIFGTLLKDMSSNDDATNNIYWKEQLTRILNCFEESSAKLAASQSECVSLRQLYNQLDAVKVNLENALESNAAVLNTSREECRTSIENYQTQLQTLTEHLTGQNDIIAAQRDLIDRLRCEAPNICRDNISNPKAPTASTASNFVSKAFAGFKKS